MAKVRLLNGKPLTVGGKVALGDDCCCQTSVLCALPEGVDCPHSVCFELKLDSSDTSSHDFLEVRGGSHVRLGMYYDGSWQIYSDTDNATAAATNPNDWHSFVLQFYAPGDGTVRCKWSVDAVAQTEIEVVDAGEDAFTYLGNNFLFGAKQGSGNPHRTLRNVAVKANPSSAEEDFSFPPDSFDSLIGGAAIVAGELQIDATGSDCYAEKDFDPGYDLLCAPVEGCLCVGNVNITVTVDVSVTHGLDGDGHTCNFHVHQVQEVVNQFGANLCGDAFGPYDFLYPGFDEGEISIPGPMIIGLAGPDPPPICFTWGVVAQFVTNNCGLGATSFGSGGPVNCFTVCDPPGSFSQVVTVDLGMGDSASVTVDLTIS